MGLRVPRFEVDLCLQTSYKMMDYHLYRESDVVLSVVKTFVQIGSEVSWKMPREILVP